MSLWDTLIPRLQAEGLTVHDVRGRLPRNGGPWMSRPLSAVNKIAYHWDAEHRPHEYDTLARIIAQAWYHINKDWGGGAHGDGLQYAAQIDNIGDLYITRNIEDVLWSVGDMNYSTMSVCWHGLNQAPTREQVEAMQKLSEVLTQATPEIPAGQGQVLGHQEVPGNATSCNGSFLQPTRDYRNERNTHPERYVYDWPEPTPPTPPADNRPEWEKRNTALSPTRTMYINQDTYLFDITNGQSLTGTSYRLYKKGERIDELAAETAVGAQVYWRTPFAVSKGKWQGFKREHLSEQLVQEPQPEPKPEPKPEPPAQPSAKDAEQDKRLSLIESLLKAVTDFLDKVFRWR